MTNINIFSFYTEDGVILILQSLRD